MKPVDNRRNAAPDGGYGWVIVFSAGIVAGFIASTFRCLGLVYGAMVERSEHGHAEIATACVLPRVMTATLAIVGNKLSEVYSFRATMGCGMLIASIAMVLSSFATRSTSLFTLTFGVLLGSGFGLTLTNCTMITGLYFTKRRSLAIGVMTSISNVNTFFTPMLLQLLFDEYHLEGALLVLGGIILHGCAAALLIRQPRWDRRREPKPVTPNDEGNVEEINRHATPKNCVDFWTTILKEFRQDLRHFRNYFFVLLLVNRAVQFFGMVSVSLILPRFVLEQTTEITHTRAAFLVSLISIGEIIARIFAGWFMTIIPKWIKISYLTSLIILAVLSSSFQLAYTYVQLAICAVLYGLIAGYAFVGYFVTIFDHFGPKKTPGANALQFTFSSYGLLFVGPTAAWIRDVTGSYAYCLFLASTLNVISVVLWLSEPYFKRKRDVIT